MKKKRLELLILIDELIMNIHILIILSVRDCLKRIFGDHYPSEIVRQIILAIYKPPKINCGSFHTTLIKNEKTYVWGQNHEHQLGLGWSDKNSPRELLLRNTVDNSITKFSKIKCGIDHTIALTPESELYVWGNNQYGQLGCGENERFRNIPFKLLDSVKKINCSMFHTIVLTKSNEIYGWGSNFYNGSSYPYYQYSPIKVQLPNVIVKSIRCGNSHTIIVTKCHKIYVWGHNESGLE